MKREVSTSTIGHDEARKPLMAAYMLQRRILFCCSILMVLSLMIWILAIATDRWIIISSGGGIFIPETRRFFMNSHSGLWRHCRFTISPNALPNADVIRNFTSIAYQSPNTLNDAKLNATRLPFAAQFRSLEVEFPITNFTENCKKRMFAHWIRDDEIEFKTFKSAFEKLVLSTPEARSDIIPIDAPAVAVDPQQVKQIIKEKTFGNALQNLTVNNNSYYFVIPEPVQMVIFEDWSKYPYVPKLFWPYARDLGLPAFVLNEDRVILQLVPPKPPKRGGQANGFDYVPNRRCKYIDMFPNANSLRNDPGIDDNLMDYIRTQASFACITVFVMCLGAVFSFYTFRNPRYMFKRLAGGIHLVAASTAMVVLQVLIASIQYTREHLFYSYPDGAVLTYGYGIYLAWFTFAMNILCGLIFMWYSGKKKGAKAPCDEVAMADEPTIMGR